MGKIIIYALIGLGSIAIIMVVIGIIKTSLNPLRKPIEEIREGILELTPIGMSMEDVLEIIESKDEWRLKSLVVREERGVLFDKRRNGPLDYANYIEKQSEHFDIIGEKSIRVGMGQYPGFLVEVFVRAWWAFDEDSNLIDVLIEKSG